MPDDTPSSDRRNKLFGRLVVVGLLLLIAVYLAPMFLSLLKSPR
jgi:hypothetical protein